MKCFTRLACFSLLLASLFTTRAHAQYSVEMGGGLYPNATPHLTSHVSLLRDLTGDGKTFSITSIEMRGLSEGQPVYVSTTGIAQLIDSTTLGKHALTLYGLAQGGTAVSDGAVSGAFNGGFALAYNLKPSIDLVFAGQGFVAPTAGGWNPLVTVGIRFNPFRKAPDPTPEPVKANPIAIPKFQ